VIALVPERSVALSSMTFVTHAKHVISVANQIRNKDDVAHLEHPICIGRRPWKQSEIQST
jgi:hypothetical protein